MSNTISHTVNKGSVLVPGRCTLIEDTLIVLKFILGIVLVKS